MLLDDPVFVFVQELVIIMISTYHDLAGQSKPIRMDYYWRKRRNTEGNSVNSLLFADK